MEFREIHCYSYHGQRGRPLSIIPGYWLDNVPTIFITAYVVELVQLQDFIIKYVLATKFNDGNTA